MRTMNPEGWQQIENLFHAAIEQPVAMRAAFLQPSAGEDVELRREVEAISGRRFGRKRHAGIACATSGGMGEVYLAEDTRLNRKVAIKLLPTLFTSDADRVRRFEQEALAISALNHPNIITIHEFSETTAGRFLVMEHVKGQTLRTKMAEPVPLDS